MTGPVEQVLRDAKALIDRPERWTKGSMEDIKDGEICYCSFGAMRAATGNTFRRWSIPYDFVFGAIGGVSVVDWNDAPERTHGEVMDAFDRAILQAQREGV